MDLRKAHEDLAHRRTKEVEESAFKEQQVRKRSDTRSAKADKEDAALERAKDDATHLQVIVGKEAARRLREEEKRMGRMVAHRKETVSSVGVDCG